MSTRAAAEIREFATTIVESIVPMETTIGRGYEISDKGRYVGLMEAYEVARAYLALVPADDETPIDEEFLRGIGFVPYDHLEHMTLESPYSDIAYRDCRISWNVWEGDDGWQIGDAHTVNIPPLKTRGDVRQLAAALGIPLTPAGPAMTDKFDYAIHLGNVLLQDDFAGAPLCTTVDEGVVRGAIRTVIDLAITAHDQQRAAELCERVESAAKEIDRQQKAKHSDLTFTGDRYFRGALSANEMRDIIEAALAAPAK